MNRLQQELRRLYLPQPTAGRDADAGETSLIDAGGQVRALVLELARPADWHAVSKVWNGVQADLGLPAPAVAVSGTDGYQLWFSLLEPVPAPQAWAFLDALRVHYLGDVEAERVTLMPAPASASLPHARHAANVPAPRGASGHWSAFVAPDLAAMFADEPWLGVPPNEDGQSRLLSRLESIQPAGLQQALARLRSAAQPPRPEPAAATPPAAGFGLPRSDKARSAANLDAKDFLLGVMNDDTLALRLRIEAAKALLQSNPDSGRR